MDDAIGYFAVMVPEQNFWQGFFLPSQLEKGAADLADRIREALPEMPRRQFPSTLVEMPGVSDADQSLVAVLASMIVQFIEDQSQLEIGLAGIALARLIDAPFFYIEARIVPNEGTRTTLTRIPARTVDQARDFLKVLPLVAEINRNAEKAHQKP